VFCLRSCRDFWLYKWQMARNQEIIDNYPYFSIIIFSLKPYLWSNCDTLMHTTAGSQMYGVTIQEGHRPALHPRFPVAGGLLMVT
jgi:hypothetical protein